MDLSAIHSIRDMAVAQQANELLQNFRNIKPVIALPSDYKTIDLEKFIAKPTRFRGIFNTQLIDEFVSYINKAGSTSTGIFVNPEDASAQAIVDMGDNNNPEWGEHKAILALKKSPEFSRLLELAGKTLSQQDLIDFAEDWTAHIQFISDQDESLDFRASLNAIRRLTVSATQNNESVTGNFNASQSSLDAIEVKAAGAVLPFGFIYTCIPYESFEQVVLFCQLRSLTDGKNVNLKYRITALDMEINNIGLQFKEFLQKSITLEANFYTGTMQYQK